MLVCATLASSLDRFQARIVWLLPLALALLARRRAHHSAGCTWDRGPDHALCAKTGRWRQANPVTHITAASPHR
jgi:hypothetical protein